METTRAYEAMIILKSAGGEAELAQAVAAVEEPVRKAGGRIANSTSWGRRRLTYRINRQAEGHYQLVQFELPPAQLSEVKRALTLNEGIVRFMILSRDEVATPAAAAAAAAS